MEKRNQAFNEHNHIYHLNIEISDVYEIKTPKYDIQRP